MTGPSIKFGKDSYGIDEEIKFEVLPGDVHPMAVEVTFSASVAYANGATANVTAPANIQGTVANVEGFGYTVTPDAAATEGFHYLADPA